MAIINRLARLFKADMHAVLDHIEEPELQLKQAIREMEEELAVVTANIRQQKLDLAMLADRRLATQALVAQTDEEITLCFENKNDDLARGLVRKKLEISAMLTAINQANDKASKALSALQDQHKEYSDLLQGMQQKADLIGSKLQGAPYSGFDNTARDTFAVSDSDIEVALLKERQRFDSPAKAS